MYAIAIEMFPGLTETQEEAIKSIFSEHRYFDLIPGLYITTREENEITRGFQIVQKLKSNYSDYIKVLRMFKVDSLSDMMY